MQDQVMTGDLHRRWVRVQRHICLPRPHDLRARLAPSCAHSDVSPSRRTGAPSARRS